MIRFISYDRGGRIVCTDQASPKDRELVKKSRRARRSRPSAKAPAPSRARVVWGALLTAMTGVGGFLWILQGGPNMGGGGLALPPMVAAAGPTSIEAIFRTRAEVPRGRWQAIVIHQSGSAFGTPASIEAEHKARSYEGMGFHFLVGNGSGLEDGEIHVGYRWLDQAAGTHAAGKQADWFNRNSIGICLVGDFSRKAPTERQIWRLNQLVQSLSDRLGIPADRVYLHRDIAQTNDPGAFFPEAAFRAQLARPR